MQKKSISKFEIDVMICAKISNFVKISRTALVADHSETELEPRANN